MKESMTQYLTPESNDAFLDFPKKEPYRNLTEECQKCKGHGGWNLRINAYPLRGEDTPENRHKYAHFRASCNVCGGWGFRKKGETCLHKWGNRKNVGRCLNEYTCEYCGKICKVDSSD